jgi:hypothetical protein
MHHDEWKPLLYSYIRYELNPDEEQSVREHLVACAVCSQELLQLQRMHQFIEMQRPYVVSPWFSTRLMARIQDEERSIWSGVENLSKRFLVGFALLVLLLVGVSIIQKEEPVSLYNYFAQSSSPTEQNVLTGDKELSREDILGLALSSDRSGNNR